MASQRRAGAATLPRLQSRGGIFAVASLLAPRPAAALVAIAGDTVALVVAGSALMALGIAASVRRPSVGATAG